MNESQQDLLNDFVEQAKPANIGKRIGAAVIDGIILMVIFIIIGTFWGERTHETTTSTVTTTTEGGAPRTTREVTTSTSIELSGIGDLIYLGCWFLVMAVLEGRTGQTIGKMALRVRVIRLNGEPTNIGASFLRHLFDIVDCMFLIGLIIAANNPQHKRIGDMVAGTYVVDKG